MIRRVTVRTGGRDYAQAAVANIATLNTTDQPVKHVIADRGFSGKVADNFAFPITELGVKFTVDLPNVRPTVTSLHGAVITDGDAYCPCAPHLTGLPRLTGISIPTQVKIRPKYDARAEFRATRRGTNENGSYRMECPARAGRVRCPLVPE